MILALKNIDYTRWYNQCMTWIGDRGESGIVIIKIYREIVAAVARKAHNLEVGGSIPSLATNDRLTAVIKSRFPIF